MNDARPTTGPGGHDVNQPAHRPKNDLPPISAIVEQTICFQIKLLFVGQMNAREVLLKAAMRKTENVLGWTDQQSCAVVNGADHLAGPLGIAFRIELSNDGLKVEFA